MKRLGEIVAWTLFRHAFDQIYKFEVDENYMHDTDNAGFSATVQEALASLSYL